MLSVVRAKYKIVAGRKERYKAMLAKIGNRDPQMWSMVLRDTIRKLKTPDRISWFLRKARGTQPEYPEDLDPHFKNVYEIRNYLDVLSHFIESAEINGYNNVLAFRFGRKSVDEVFGELNRLEVEANNSTSEEKRIVLQGQDKTFKRFKDGWEWHLLDRPACAGEGAAMRHCGNQPSQKKGQRILSLREPVKKKGKTYWKPHATFIWNADGSLGEMKGFANAKPGEKLHPYIVSLLEDPKITGIRGGGYAARNNFKISDLSEETKLQLQEVRPELVKPTKEFDLDDLIEQINEYVADEEARAVDVTENEDLAHYAYSDIEWDDSSLNRNLQEDVYTLVMLLKRARPASWKDIVKGATEVRHVHGIHATRNTLGSIGIGEVSVYFPDDLGDQLEDLSDEDFEKVKGKVNCYISDNDKRTGIINMEYDSFRAIIDEDMLRDAVEEVINEQFEAIVKRVRDEIEKKKIDVNTLEIEVDDQTIYYTKKDSSGDEQLNKLVSVPEEYLDYDKGYLDDLLKEIKRQGQF